MDLFSFAGNLSKSSTTRLKIFKICLVTNDKRVSSFKAFEFQDLTAGIKVKYPI